MNKKEKVTIFISRFVAGIFCFFIPKLITGSSGIFMLTDGFFAGLDITDYILRTICFLIGTLVVMYSFNIFSEINNK
jgi:hypothetical protein